MHWFVQLVGQDRLVGALDQAVEREGRVGVLVVLVEDCGGHCRVLIVEIVLAVVVARLWVLVDGHFLLVGVFLASLDEKIKLDDDWPGLVFVLILMRKLIK
ncbi:hypothetical protein BpHYR1_045890 [Brachionus plicatilis]|uniref:Uncharacterized protein n=1 Tax=Brachionus plicatilis TaxID=10195 RepID=A0A3M7S755_BRAPC|nr:hypothetical protein BpHYR1_045890 [Brachionus plicatilis]